MWKKEWTDNICGFLAWVTFIGLCVAMVWPGILIFLVVLFSALSAHDKKNQDSRPYHSHAQADESYPC